VTGSPVTGSGASVPVPPRRVRVVVVNFNGGDAVVRCVDALRALDTRHHVEIVVVDNDSTDGSPARVRERPGVAVWPTGSNLGFVANNLALADLTGLDYVALVNNDAFVEPGWLEPLVEALEADPALGAVQSKIVFDQRGGDGLDVINNVGGIVLADGSGADRGWGEADRGQYDESEEVFAWCGGATLLRPGYLRDVGLFDDRLFLYYEDTDLSWRGRARGWRYRYEPRSVVRHLHAASTGATGPVFGYYNERNRLVVLVKNAPAALARRAALRHPLSTLSYLRSALRDAWVERRPPDLGVVAVRLRAYGGFLVLLPAALVARRRIARGRTRPAAEVDAWIGRA
jgi:N-acetylglucosaminyl-diphospho-decaprenol L-rhamnosyltransferase